MLNSKVMNGGVVNFRNYIFAIISVFLSVIGLLDVLREYKVRETESTWEIPDDIQIVNILKCPNCKGKIAKGMHKCCLHCGSELYKMNSFNGLE